MKRAIFLLISVLSFAQCSNRYLNKPLTQQQIEQDERNHNCITTTKYTPAERMQFYPFNTSAIVKVVSFTNSDSIIVEHSLPMKGEEIDYSLITEQKVLTKEQIDELTSILYNVTYQGEIFLVSESGCYNPRNAILFCDKNNNLLEFIEICFECGGSRLSSEKISLGDMCDQKLSLLKSLFLTAGIEIGTIKELLYQRQN